MLELTRIFHRHDCHPFPPDPLDQSGPGANQSFSIPYGSADVTKPTQAWEVTVFCDQWKQIFGADPVMLIMDQKATTQAEYLIDHQSLICREPGCNHGRLNPVRTRVSGLFL